MKKIIAYGYDDKNEYRLYWIPLENESDDGSMMADWENPTEIEKIECNIDPVWYKLQ